MPTMPSPKAIQTYMTTTMAYGLCHTLAWTRDMKHEYTYKKPVDLLLVDKFVLCYMNTAASPFMWPFFCYKDAKLLELYLRGKREEDYP